ncbi:MAG TPA: RNA polymerase sigma factor [Hyphomicrobiaceae bacterium]
MKEPVDQGQIERAAGGCPAALAALIEAHYGSIYRMAWRLIGTREEAQDVAQDVCVKLASAVRSFRGDAQLPTWLYRVTYNTAIDHMRTRQRLRRGEQADVVVLFQGRAAESAETAMAGSELWVEVRRLPPQQRDAVILVYAEDLSHAEAAAIMGCTEKTVSWHLHEARKRLRARLDAVS